MGVYKGNDRLANPGIGGKRRTARTPGSSQIGHLPSIAGQRCIDFSSQELKST
jgi:hypothetical protein